VTAKKCDVRTYALAIHRREIFLQIGNAASVVADEHGRDALRQEIHVRFVLFVNEVIERMRMRIDKTRHDGHAACIDDEIGRRICGGIHRRNPIAGDADVRIARFGQRAVVYSTVDDQHGVTFSLTRLPR
jgi:hypothetical protein